MNGWTDRNHDFKLEENELRNSSTLKANIVYKISARRIGSLQTNNSDKTETRLAKIRIGMSQELKDKINSWT